MELDASRPSRGLTCDQGIYAEGGTGPVPGRVVAWSAGAAGAVAVGVTSLKGICAGGRPGGRSWLHPVRIKGGSGRGGGFRAEGGRGAASGRSGFQGQGDQAPIIQQPLDIEQITGMLARHRAAASLPAYRSAKSSTCISANPNARSTPGRTVRVRTG